MRVFAALVLALLTGMPAEAKPSAVSMNACTDYLALLLADESQLKSVSWLARDEIYNPRADLAARVPVNYGTVEEVLPLAPEVVLAGTTTTRATVDLLRRLGLRVVELPYVFSLEAIPANIRTVAEALDQREKGEALIAAFEANLAASKAADDGPRPVIALYGAGGHAAGPLSLEGDAARHAGFDNLATRLGPYGGTLTLEDLILSRPDLVVLPQTREGRPSLSQAMLLHPALAQTGPRVTIDQALFACEGPGAAEGAALLSQARTP
jgi:iron complex transport system substrate-binding protein